MRQKGMGHVQTMQGLVNRGKPTSRAEVASRMNSLEHKRERMIRERDVWADKLKQADGQIQQLDQQLETLREMMTTLLTEQETPKKPKNTRSISLEY